MKKLLKLIFYLLPFFIFILHGCEKNTIILPSRLYYPVIYFNSFEFSRDTIGWQGYGKSIFYDAPINGGKRSLHISGGCLVPHAWVDFPNKSPFSDFKLRCWGKNLSNGGTIILRSKNDLYKSINISINDSTWRQYQSYNVLHLSPNDTFRLEFISGGYVSSAMLVDLIEVVSAR